MSTLRALVVVHACALATVAQDASGTTDPVAARATAKSLRVGPAFDAELRKGLDKRVSVEWTDVPLKDAIEKLADLGELPFVIDDIALEEEGVPLDEPITHRAGNVWMHTLLDRVLEPLNLTYICRAETVIVTSTVVAEELGNHLTVTYDVRELVGQLSGKAEEDDVLESERTYPAESEAAKRATNRNSFNDLSRFDVGDIDAEELADTLVRITGPNTSWADQGGPGDVVFVRGLAVVRQTQDVQREVDQLLAELDAFVRSEPGDRAVRLFETEDDRRIRATLDQKVDVNFVDVPLTEALATLAAKVNVDVQVDTIALEAEGIPLDEPVNLVLKGKSLRTVLAHVLTRLNLTTLVTHESLRVTSTVVAEDLGNLETIVVDVRGMIGTDPDDLIDVIVRLNGPPESWADQGGYGDITVLADRFLIARQSQGITNEILALVDDLRMRPPHPREKRRPKEDELLLLDYTIVEHDVAEIVDLIETMVEPENGPGDRRIVIRKVGRQLFVRTTYAHHRRIHALLSKLNAYSSFGISASGFTPGVGSGVFSVEP